MPLEDRLRSRFDALFHRWGANAPRPMGPNSVMLSPQRGEERGMIGDEDHFGETLTYLLDGARVALEAGHSFAPFGATTRHDGERSHVRIDVDNAALTAHDAIGLLARGLKQDSTGLAVAGLAYDGEIRTERGAVRAVCLHIETPVEALEAFVPYVRDPQRGLTLHRPIVKPTSPAIFPR